MICVNHRQSHVGLILYRIMSKCRTVVNQMARIIVVCVLDLWFGGRLKDKAIEKNRANIHYILHLFSTLGVYNG